MLDDNEVKAVLCARGGYGIGRIIEKINFSAFKNFEDNVKEKASIYVPAVGKVTIAMLERNLLRLYDYQSS